VRIWSTLTASSSTTPRATFCQNDDTSISVSPLSSVPRISTASAVPHTEPRPPNSEVPPSTTAAMMVSRCWPAASGALAPSIAARISPAKAPTTPEKM